MQTQPSKSTHGRYILLSAVSSACVLSFGGCVAVENDRNVEEPTIRPVRVWFAQTASPTDTVVLADTSTASALDRSTWTHTHYFVADGSVAHAPSYAPQYNVLNWDTYRGTTMPTVASSIAADYQSNMSNMEQAKLALVAPALAAFDFVAILPRMVVEEQPWNAVTSPDSSPARVNQTPHQPASLPQ